jgi:hypothetical protein
MIKIIITSNINNKDRRLYMDIIILELMVQKIPNPDKDFCFSEKHRFNYQGRGAA